MESINLEMEDLFDSEAVGDDEDVGMRASLPQLDEDGEGPMRDGNDEEMADSQQDGEDGGVVANLQRLSKGAAKKRVMRPQPKLDVDRLKTDRGLPILPRMFVNVKFKGKGHEVDDLKLMMGKLEHWAHRLFPKMPFDEFTERLEKLGAKKAVQTCVSRIRLDMPVLDEDYVAQYNEEPDQPPEGAENNVDGDADQRIAGDEEEDLDAEDAFEEMMRREKEAQEERKRQEQDQDVDSFLAESQISNGERVRAGSQSAQIETAGKTVTEVNLQPSQGGTSLSQPTSQQGTSLSQPTSQQGTSLSQPTSQQGTSLSQPTSQPPPSQGLTTEAKARIEENKRRALEKRAARLGVPVSALMSPKPVNKSTEPKQPSSQSPSEGFIPADSPMVTSQAHSVKSSQGHDKSSQDHESSSQGHDKSSQGHASSQGHNKSSQDHDSSPQGRDKSSQGRETSLGRDGSSQDICVPKQPTDNTQGSSKHGSTNAGNSPRDNRPRDNSPHEDPEDMQTEDQILSALECTEESSDHGSVRKPLEGTEGTEVQLHLELSMSEPGDSSCVLEDCSLVSGSSVPEAGHEAVPEAAHSDVTGDVESTQPDVQVDNVEKVTLQEDS